LTFGPSRWASTSRPVTITPRPDRSVVTLLAPAIWESTRSSPPFARSSAMRWKIVSSAEGIDAVDPFA